MILFLESHNGERESYKINSYSDLEPLFKNYPNVEYILEETDDLKSCVDAIAEYLGSGTMDSWVEHGLEKALSPLKAISAAAIMAMPTALSAPPTVTHTQQAANTQQMQYPNFGTQPEDRFLHNIMQIESSGGKNINHKPVKYGVGRGHTAIGRWGLLPTTIKEILDRKQKTNQLNQDHTRLRKMNPKQLKDHLSQNPHIELDLARYLARHVINRQNGDMRRSAYSWLYGHNLYPADITEEKMKNDDYVNKYVNLVKPQKTLASMNKTEDTFKERLNLWYKAREEKSRQDNDFDMYRTTDPGRKITSEEEKDTRTKTGNIITDLTNTIEEAKRANKRS
jgi:hypothetical protein